MRNDRRMEILRAILNNTFNRDFMNNTLKQREYRRRYREKWKMELKEYYKEYRKKESYTKKRNEWVGKNRDRVNRIRGEWGKEQIKNNPKFRISAIMNKVIWEALNGDKRGQGWVRLVGYTASDLIKHLEDLFTPQMSWANHGSYWEIDHIKPKALFSYETAEDKEFQECWGLENLQPLEKTKNRKKGKKYEEK